MIITGPEIYMSDILILILKCTRALIKALQFLCSLKYSFPFHFLLPVICIRLVCLYEKIAMSQKRQCPFGTKMGLNGISYCQADLSFMTVSDLS